MAPGWLLGAPGQGGAAPVLPVPVPGRDRSARAGGARLCAWQLGEPEPVEPLVCLAKTPTILLQTSPPPLSCLLPPRPPACQPSTPSPSLRPAVAVACTLHASLPLLLHPKEHPRSFRTKGMVDKSFVSIPSCCPAEVWRKLAAAWLLSGELPVRSGHKQPGTELWSGHRPQSCRYSSLCQCFRLLVRCSREHGSSPGWAAPACPQPPSGSKRWHQIWEDMRGRERWPSCCRRALQGHGPAWLLLTRWLCLWPKAAGLPATTHGGFGLPCCHAQRVPTAPLRCAGVLVHPAAMPERLVLCTALCVPPSPAMQPWPWSAPALHAALGFGPETSPHPPRWRHEEGPDVPLVQPGADAGCLGLLSTGRTAASSRPAPFRTLPLPTFRLHL